MDGEVVGAIAEFCRDSGFRIYSTTGTIVNISLGIFVATITVRYEPELLATISYAGTYQVPSIVKLCDPDSFDQIAAILRKCQEMKNGMG